MDRVPRADARQRVLTTAQSYFNGPTFAVSAWPQAASQVSDSAKLTLALVESPERAKDVCENADSSVPGAPMPRRFINAIVAIAPTRRAFDDAVDRAQRLIAAELVKKDYERHGEPADTRADRPTAALNISASAPSRTCRADIRHPRQHGDDAGEAPHQQRPGGRARWRASRDAVRPA